MDIFLAVLGGTLCKLYDDLKDMKLVKSEKLNEILKGSQWMLLTLLSMYDFNFSILVYIINFTNSSLNPEEWSDAYESSLLYLYPILILLSFHTRKYISIGDSVVFICIVLFMSIETALVTEESSYTKLLSRSILALISIIVVSIVSYSTNSFNISLSVIKIVYYLIGYTITSIFFQAYNLYIIPSSTEVKTPPTEVSRLPPDTLPVLPLSAAQQNLMCFANKGSSISYPAVPDPIEEENLVLPAEDTPKSSTDTIPLE